MAGTNTDESLPLASIFKLYVLYAVADAIKAGTVSWDDQLTVTDKGKAVGSGMELAVGDHISVRTAAEKMIATSDNMATDMLIGKLGTHAIEEALATAGHHDPASMTPFPTMYELFSVGWGQPDVREQWKSGSPQARAQMLQEADSACLQTGSDARPRAGLRHTARNGMATLRISAGCTRRCRPAQSAQPRPSSRSCRPSGCPAGSARLAIYRRESRWAAG